MRRMELMRHEREAVFASARDLIVLRRVARGTFCTTVIRSML